MTGQKLVALPSDGTDLKSLPEVGLVHTPAKRMNGTEQSAIWLCCRVKGRDDQAVARGSEQQPAQHAAPAVPSGGGEALVPVAAL